MVQLLCKTLWQFLPKVKNRITIRLSNSTSRYILGDLKTYVHTKTHTQMFIAALFITMVELPESGNNPNIYQPMSGLTEYY